MRPALSRCNGRSDACPGPNWRGVGQVEVHAVIRAAGIGPGKNLLIDFDRRRVLAGGCFLLEADGVPEVLQFKRCPRGLRARMGGRWVKVTPDDLYALTVIGQVVGIIPSSA